MLPNCDYGYAGAASYSLWFHLLVIWYMKEFQPGRERTGDISIRWVFFLYFLRGFTFYYFDLLFGKAMIHLRLLRPSLPTAQSKCSARRQCKQGPPPLYLWIYAEPEALRVWYRRRSQATRPPRWRYEEWEGYVSRIFARWMSEYDEYRDDLILRRII